MRRNPGNHAVIILRIALCLLQCLLSAGGMTGEIRIFRWFSVKRLDDFFRRHRHQMCGPKSEILPYFRILNAAIRFRRSTHIRIGRSVTGLQPAERFCDAASRTAVSRAEKSAVPLVVVRQPYFNIDARTFRRHQHQFNDCPRRHVTHFIAIDAEMNRVGNPSDRQNFPILDFQFHHCQSISGFGVSLRDQYTEE
ncbi:hypothetical protein SDC9_174492 [bioreactor metagenome]|uniref:Uncharacterized protein n=1 Tax=bioreactor metagenome TaxID=1076179 RepID=A0A645GK25_9ZZZZ